MTRSFSNNLSMNDLLAQALYLVQDLFCVESDVSRIHVTVGPQTVDFRASMTVEAVEKTIRGKYGLQFGGLELDNLDLVEGDAFVPGTTYSFVGGIPLGKSPSLLPINESFAGSSTCCALNPMS